MQNHPNDDWTRWIGWSGFQNIGYTIHYKVQNEKNCYFKMHGLVNSWTDSPIFKALVILLIVKY